MDEAFDMADGFDAEIELFLATCRTATLATVDGAGVPYAANIQYASCDSGGDERANAFAICWVSSVEAAHSVHVGEGAEIAVAIYGHDDRAANIHGLQMRGVAEPIETDVGWPGYVGKYPFVADPPFRERVRKQQFYRFTPTWLRWIDNRVRFGFKQEISL